MCIRDSCKRSTHNEKGKGDIQQQCWRHEYQTTTSEAQHRVDWTSRSQTERDVLTQDEILHSIVQGYSNEAQISRTYSGPRAIDLPRNKKEAPRRIQNARQQQHNQTNSSTVTAANPNRLTKELAPRTSASSPEFSVDAGLVVFERAHASKSTT